MNASPQMNAMTATLPITMPAMAPDDNESLLDDVAEAVLELGAGVVVIVTGALLALPIPPRADVVAGCVVVRSTVLV
jgi:hypothetical protein